MEVDHWALVSEGLWHAVTIPEVSGDELTACGLSMLDLEIIDERELPVRAKTCRSCAVALIESNR